MDESQLNRAVWRKSRRSSAQGENCVEVAKLPGAVAFRDSKNPDGGVLAVTRAQWRTFTHKVRA